MALDLEVLIFITLFFVILHNQNGNINLANPGEQVCSETSGRIFSERQMQLVSLKRIPLCICELGDTEPEWIMIKSSIIAPSS